jgi:hypothetical protein
MGHPSQTSISFFVAESIANICEKIRKTKIHIFYQTSAEKQSIGHHRKTKIHKFYQTSENHPIGP